MITKRKQLHPATFFFLLTLVVIFVSWVCNVYGLSVRNPHSGELIAVENLLSVDGVRWWLREVAGTFTDYSKLGMVVLAIFGFGIADHSGLTAVCIRRRNGLNVRRIRVIIVIVLGLLSNLIGEAGYILLLPIAAILFRNGGLPSSAGIIVGYVSVSSGYSANVFISTLDVTQARITQEAVLSIGKNPDTIGPIINYYFMIASFVCIGCVIYMLTMRWLVPAINGNQVTVEVAPSLPLSRRERRALVPAIFVGCVYALCVGLLAVTPHGALRGVTGSLLVSPFMDGCLFLLVLGLGLMGLVYGFVSGRYRTDRDVVQGLLSSLRLLGVYVCIAFFASQMLAALNYSHLHQYIVAWSGQHLPMPDGHPLLMLVWFILFVSMINLIMPSAGGKWSLLAFIFIPVFVHSGIAPEYAQCAYRIGDSITNSVTPILMYVPWVLAFLQRKDTVFGYPMLFRYTWRFSLSIGLVWIALFLVWYLFKWRLGL